MIHLVGGAHQPDDDAVMAANHGSVVTALAAARQADVRRFILVSVPGASPDARDPYLRAKGLAEEAVVHSGLEHAVIRSTHLYGLGGLWFTAVVQAALADPPLVPGDPEAVLAPGVRGRSRRGDRGRRRPRRRTPRARGRWRDPTP